MLARFGRFERVWISDVEERHAAEMSGLYEHINFASSISQAVAKADIDCLCTSS
jgi:hypothetical protein